MSTGTWPGIIFFKQIYNIIRFIQPVYTGELNDTDQEQTEIDDLNSTK